MKANLSLSQPPVDLSGTIFYLRKSLPRVHDANISGPYQVMDMIRLQMLHQFGKTSYTPFTYFHEGFPDDAGEEGPIPLTNWGRVIGPLANNPRHTIRIEVLTEHNPAVAAKLPGPCYLIIFCKCKQLPGTKTEQSRSLFGYAPLEHMEVHGTFLDRDEAEAAARKFLKEKLEEFPGSQETVVGWKDDEFMCIITKEGSSGTSEIQAFIQVRRNTE